MRLWLSLIDRVKAISLDLLQSSSEAIKWSNIGAVGRSNLGRLTILMPFIGYLIIFNPSFINFFRSSLPAMQIDAPHWLLSLNSHRLSFLYFGLLFLGAGIGLFTLFAPEEIRGYRNISEYIADMEAVSSPTLVKDKFEGIVARFLNTNRGERSHPVFGPSSLSFPALAESYLHQLIASLFRELPDGLVSDDAWSTEIEGTMVMASPYFFVGAAGHILTDKIMEVIISGRLVDRHFREEVGNAAIARRKEVFYLDYMSSNYSAYVFRVFVAVLILIGFSLLLLPTITTSFLAALATFKQM